jgi:hypothetical protein
VHTWGWAEGNGPRHMVTPTLFRFEYGFWNVGGAFSCTFDIGTLATRFCFGVFPGEVGWGGRSATFGGDPVALFVVYLVVSAALVGQAISRTTCEVVVHAHSQCCSGGGVVPTSWSLQRWSLRRWCSSKVGWELQVVQVCDTVSVLQVYFLWRFGFSDLLSHTFSRFC